MLISWITWVRSLCMTRVEVAGDFFRKTNFGHKSSTYTRVNMVSPPFFCCAKNNVLKKREQIFR